MNTRIHSYTALAVKVLLFNLFLVVGLFAQGNWVIDQANSNINFSVQHMMISDVTGNFEEFSGTIQSILDDFSDMRVSVSINAGSINTHNSARDNHLKGSEFFNVQKYDNIVFKSTRIDKKDDQHFIVTGDLTMHGVTRSVDLDVTYKGKVKTTHGDVAIFKATTTIDRTQWGLTWNRFLENGGILVGDDVQLTFNIEARQQ